MIKYKITEKKKSLKTFLIKKKRREDEALKKRRDQISGKSDREKKVEKGLPIKELQLTGEVQKKPKIGNLFRKRKAQNLILIFVFL